VLQRIFGSPYCYIEQWLEGFAQQKRNWMSLDAIAWVIDVQMLELSKEVSPFPGRAKRYAILAVLAVIHGISDKANDLLRLSMENMISHGEHKDMLFFQVLETLRMVANAALDNKEVQNIVRDLLIAVVPAIVHVKDYTDGDETGNLSHELSETLSIVAPGSLGYYYMWLAKREKYYDATDAFHVFIETADLSNLMNQATARTAVDDESLRILDNRAKKGDEIATAIINEQIAYYGNEVLNRVDVHETVEPQRRQSEIDDGPDIKAYGPLGFSEYAAAVGNSRLVWDQNRVLQWITFWSNLNCADQAYQGILDFINTGGELRDYDTVFELALRLYGKEKAYPWLVKAHVANRGWRQYYSDKEESKRRWNLVKKLYPEKWMDFLQETLLSKQVSTWDWYINELEFVWIIEYFLFFDQVEMATELLQTVVHASLEYVSLVKFDTPEWITQ